MTDLKLLGLIVAGLWIFVITATLLAVAAGWVGTQIARRTGRQCPECDYRAGPEAMRVHEWEHDYERR